MGEIGNTSHHNSDHNSKMERRSDDEDVFSTLPDDVIHNILHFLPTKFAIRTSILSKRWNKIWCEAPCLSFDGHRLLADSINKTLIGYTAKKIINFHLTTNTLVVTAAQMDSYIEFIMPRNPESLSMEFTLTAGYSFPDFFYKNAFVKNLRLDLWHCPTNPSCDVSWTSLKSLSLHFRLLPDDLVAIILSGCPVLESLTLSFYSQLRVLDLRNSPRLSRLDLHCRNSRRESTEIIAPYIHYLRLENLDTPETRFTLLDVSSLTEADLDISSLSNDASMVNGFQEMLATLQNIKKLTLGINFIQILSYAKHFGVIFRTVNLEALTLEITIFESVITGITEMLQTSPGLKKINVNISTSNLVPSIHLFTYLKQRGMGPDESWKIPALGYIRALKHMEREAKFVFWLVKFLLENTKSVETIVVMLGGSVSEEGYNKLLRMVAKLSRTKKVSIVLKWDDE